MNNGVNTQENNAAKCNAIDEQSAGIIQQLIEQNRALIDELKALRSSTQSAQPANGSSTAKTTVNRTGTPMICTETGLIYKSKAKAGKSVAHEFGYSEDNPPLNKAGEPSWNFIIYYVQGEPGGKYRLIEYTGDKSPGEKDEEFVLEWLSENETKYLESLKGSNRKPSPLLELIDDDDDTDIDEAEAKEKTVPPAAEKPKVEQPKTEVKQPANPQKPQNNNPQNNQKPLNNPLNKR